MAVLREKCWCAFAYGHREDALILFQKLDIDQLHQDLVYWAVKHGWVDIVQELVEKHHLSPSEKVDSIGGQRPLHKACMMGSVEMVKYLLTCPSVLLTVNEEYGDRSALDLACGNAHLSVIELLLKEPSVHMPNKQLHSDDFAVLSLLSTKMKWSTEFPIMPYFPVFMAGNSAAGKTTLTEAMLQLSHPSLSGHDRMVSAIKTLTAGICPSQCSG